MRSLVLLASLAVYNAHIWTGDSAHPWAEAISVDGDRIQAIGTNKSKQEFIDRIRKYAATSPPRAWITGGYWDHTNWGGELPTREWADAGRGTVSGGRISFELKQH